MKYFTTTDEDLRIDATTRIGLRGSFIRLTDGITHYELRGPTDAPLVILVPGLTVPLSYWDDFAEELHTRGLRTLAFSAYGRGYSDRLATDHDEELFQRQLNDLIEALNLSAQFHLAATSMGALIAMKYVVEQPSWVSSLTLIGPAGFDNFTARRQRLLRNNFIATLAAKRLGQRILLGHLEHNVADPALVPQLTRMIAETYRYEGSMFGFFSTLQHFPLANRGPLFEATGDSKVPTLLIWGTDDQVTPITGMAAARALLRPEDTRRIDCGHMAPYERPTDVAESLVDFVASHNDRTAHDQ